MFLFDYCFLFIGRQMKQFWFGDYNPLSRNQNITSWKSNPLEARGFFIQGSFRFWPYSLNRRLCKSHFIEYSFFGDLIPLYSLWTFTAAAFGTSDAASIASRRSWKVFSNRFSDDAKKRRRKMRIERRVRLSLSLAFLLLSSQAYATFKGSIKELSTFVLKVS